MNDSRIFIAAIMTAWGAFATPVLAASLAELSGTLSVEAAAAGDAADTQEPPPLPPTPDFRSDKLSQLSQLAGSQKTESRQLDNSRTDIRLFNKMLLENKQKQIQSILFTKEEINEINLAINTYLKAIGRGGEFTFDEEAFLSRLGGLKKNTAVTGESRFFTYPQFYLDSLVYHSPTDWLVWINGEKITPETPKESKNIHVVTVDNEKVTLAWFPLTMSAVLEVWKLMPNEAITIDKQRNQVIFTLRPNQTFSSYILRVLEGKQEPVIVDMSQIGEDGSAMDDIRQYQGANGTLPQGEELPPASKNNLDDFVNQAEPLPPPAALPDSPPPTTSEKKKR